MEDALRDGLAGIAHTEDVDATHALPADEATRMLTSSTRSARRGARCSRCDEPPRRQPRRQAAPPPRRKQGSGTGKWVALVIILAVIAGGVVGYQALQNAGAKSVQLNEDVSGTVDEAIDEFKALVSENTR